MHGQMQAKQKHNICMHRVVTCWVSESGCCVGRLRRPQTRVNVSRSCLTHLWALRTRFQPSQRSPDCCHSTNRYRSARRAEQHQIRTQSGTYQDQIRTKSRWVACLIGLTPLHKTKINNDYSCGTLGRKRQSRHSEVYFYTKYIPS